MSDPERFAEGGNPELAELVRALPKTTPMPAGTEARLAEVAAGLSATSAIAATGLATFKSALIALAGVGVLGGASVATWAVVHQEVRVSQPNGSTAAVAAPVTPRTPEPASPDRQSPRPPAAPVRDQPSVPSAPAANLSMKEALEQEAALLREAQVALGASPERALLLTRQHRGRFPGGKLAAERELIAIDALVRLGRRSEADALGARVLARDPEGFYAERVRGLLAR